MIIYILRHPETEWNRKGIMQGHKDSPLTGRGRKMAEKLGQKLAGKRISKIYSSDLGRCLETSRIINIFLGVRILPKRELRERDYGRFNGQAVKLIKSQFNLEDKDLVIPGGESFNLMKNRAVRFVRKLKSQDPVLVITHYGCMKAVAEEFNKKIKKNQYLAKITF